MIKVSVWILPLLPVDNDIFSTQDTVKPVYKGCLMESEDMPFMSSCPL
jgi:hypothetical protein